MLLRSESPGISQTELVRSGVATDYQINNYVQNGPVIAYLDANRHRIFDERNAYRIEIAAKLAAIIPPAVAFAVADAAMAYRGDSPFGRELWVVSRDDGYLGVGVCPTDEVSLRIPAKESGT